MRMKPKTTRIDFFREGGEWDSFVELPWFSRPHNLPLDNFRYTLTQLRGRRDFYAVTVNSPDGPLMLMPEDRGDASQRIEAVAGRLPAHLLLPRPAPMGDPFAPSPMVMVS